MDAVCLFSFHVRRVGGGRAATYLLVSSIFGVAELALRGGWREADILV